MVAKRGGGGEGLKMCQKTKFRLQLQLRSSSQALIPASPTAGGELESLQSGSYHSGDF